MSNVEGETLRYVYVLINEEHRLIYVGQTNDPDRRARSHHLAALGDGPTYRSTYLYRTMRKVGIDSFRLEVLHSVGSVAEATQAEQLWIDHLCASGEWLVLNDAKAAPPRSAAKFKEQVQAHLDQLISGLPIGAELPTIADTTRATQACGKTVQRCYEDLKKAGRIATPGAPVRYRRVA